MTRPPEAGSSRQRRETVYSHGRKGDADWLRVLVDVRHDRVEVHYKTLAGVRKRRYYEGASKKVQAKAKAWAEAFVAERQRRGGARGEITHAELWQQYTASPAWLKHIRPTTRPSYAHRWKRWTDWRGARTRPDDTTLHHIDQFIMAMLTRAKPVAINQIRETLNVVRTVYRWGFARKLLAEHAFADYRWKTPKEGAEGADDTAGPAAELGPDEYSETEFHAILAALSPQDSRRWRAWVMLMLAGYQGQRGRALVHLRWDDIDEAEGVIRWPARYQKNGRALIQPLTWDGVAALETARYWRGKLGYAGPWVLPGGSKKRRGIDPELAAWEQDPKHKRVGTGTGRPRVVADAPYHYQSAYSMLRAAEDAAGVTHRDGRAFHGFRKMVAGHIGDRTGDMRLAMEFIGDDVRQAHRYLKRRDERLDRAADAVQTQHPVTKGEA